MGFRAVFGLVRVGERHGAARFDAPVLARSPSAAPRRRVGSTSRRCSRAASSGCRCPIKKILRLSVYTKTSDAVATTTRRNSMLIAETIQKMLELKLPTMAQATREIPSNSKGP
jgi:hypothetical protein